MKIQEKGIINATPQAVWPYVAHPHWMSLWNNKLVAIKRSKEEEVQTGEKFRVRYRMSGKESESEVTVIESTPPLRVAYRHQIQTKGKEYEAIETYELLAVGEKTEFCQIIDLSKAMPWWALPIVWFLHRFGEPQGKSNTKKIEELLVADAPRRDATT